MLTCKMIHTKRDKRDGLTAFDYYKWNVECWFPEKVVNTLKVCLYIIYGPLRIILPQKMSNTLTFGYFLYSLSYVLVFA